MYDLPALESALAGTIFAGKLNFLPVTGSTNTDAALAARTGAAHGSVFFTDEQLAGRGRGDHAWQSAAGQGLYVSVLLRHAFEPGTWPLIPLAAGLATREAIKNAAGIEADLRWPNDLLIGPRKAGGILAESQPGTGAVIVGIGLNVHQREFDPGLSTPATSLDLEAGRLINRQALLICLLKSLEHETIRLGDRSAAAKIPRRVTEASTWIRGRHVIVHGPQECEGITAGLDPHGFLLVETANGIVTVQTGGIRAAE